VGFLLGFTIKRIMKILAVIAGVFFAALLYLESQHIVNVNWDKLQTISNCILSTIATTTNATTTTGGGGIGPIQSILGNNSTAAASAILPITNTMTNLGIPLTGSVNSFLFSCGSIAILPISIYFLTLPNIVSNDSTNGKLKFALLLLVLPSASSNQNC
jgi:FUN14 family